MHDESFKQISPHVFSFATTAHLCGESQNDPSSQPSPTLPKSYVHVGAGDIVTVIVAVDVVVVMADTVTVEVPSVVILTEVNSVVVTLDVLVVVATTVVTGLTVVVVVTLEITGARVVVDCEMPLQEQADE